MSLVQRVSLCLTLAVAASAQPPVMMPGTPAPYAAPTSEDRLRWLATTTVGPMSWMTGAFSSGWSTVFDYAPKEWGRSPEGFAKRYASRTANVAIASTVEAGLGAVWGEDPRYQRMGIGSFGQRTGRVVKMTFLARYRDGGTRFAYARLIGNVGGNVVQNSWMPPTGKGFSEISLNTGISFSARAAGNAFAEFWPDVRKLVFKK